MAYLCKPSFIIISIISIRFFPFTPFYKNLLIHLEFLKINSINELFTFKNFDHFIFSARLSCFRDSLRIFSESSIIQKLFGIGYVINGSLLKTSEMDYLVTLIHHGILGFIIIYYEYFKLLYIVFKNYFVDFKSNFQNTWKSSLFISIFISILCAFLAGHVLETPSVCVFVVTIIGITIKELKTNK